MSVWREGLPPPLTIAFTDAHDIVLTWPGSAGQFRLKTAAGLEAPRIWEVFAGEVTMSGELNRVTIPDGLVLPGQFFRLRR